jgi:hypothetical protein
VYRPNVSSFTQTIGLNYQIIFGELARRRNAHQMLAKKLQMSLARSVFQHFKHQRHQQYGLSSSRAFICMRDDRVRVIVEQTCSRAELRTNRSGRPLEGYLNRHTTFCQNGLSKWMVEMDCQNGWSKWIVELLSLKWSQVCEHHLR